MFRQIISHFRPFTVLGFVLLGVLVYAPALGEGRMVYGRDTVFHDYIMHLYGWNRIHASGQWPLWSPELFLGLPFLGSFALCPFYPSQWLYFLLPFNTAFTLQYALALAAGGLGMTWWMRRAGVSRTAALWAGVAFMASGHFLTLTHAGHLQKMIAIAWSPVALGALWQRYPAGESGAPVRPGKSRLILPAALAFAMQLLASHPQIFYGTAAACALLAVVRAEGATPSRFFRSAARGLVVLAAAVATGLSLSAIQMFPALETAAVSNRAEWVPFAEAVETSYPPLEVLEYAIPSVFGDSVRETPVGYFGDWGERIVSDFVGVPLLLLAALGLFSPAAPRRDRLSLAALVLVSLLVGFGRHTPLYGWLYAFLPGWKSFRSPGTFMFLADLGLIALAALGLERLLALARMRVDGAASRLAVVLFALAGAGMVAAAVAGGWRLGLDPHRSGDEAVRHHLLRGVLILGLELAVAALPAGAAVRWKRPGLAAAAALAALTVMAGHNARYLRFDPLTPYLHYLHHPVYEAARRAEPWTATVVPAQGPVRLLEDRPLVTAAILAGVGIPTGYHPVVLRRYERMTAAFPPESEEFARRMGVWLARTRGEQPPAPPARADGWELVGRYGSPPSWLWKRRGTPPSYARLSTAGDHAEGSSVTLALWSAHRIRMTFEPPLAQPALLTLAEVAAPGWKARTVEGERLVLRVDDPAQRAVEVPPGVKEVELEYAPCSVRLGGFLTLSAAALMAGVLAAGWFRHRKGETDKGGVVGPPGLEPGTSRL